MKSFRATCDALYVRHNYRLVLQNGQSIIYGSYEEAQAMWWRGGGNTFSHIEVIDAPKVKPQKSKRKGQAKGF